MSIARDLVSRASRSALIVAAALCVAGGVGGGLALAGEAAAGPGGAVEVDVGSGKSQVVELPEPYTDVMVGDPKIADVLPLNNHSIYVVGKGTGSTGVTVYGPGKRLISAISVVVSADLDTLKSRLDEILPDEKDISIRSANQSIVVSGTVKSPVAMQQVMALADSYAPGKVVNMLGVEGTQQVMLSVRFVEMERSTAKDLQLNVQSAAQPNGQSPAFQISTGDTLHNNINLLNNLIGTASLRLSRGAGGLDVLFDALETKGLVKTLAEPNLVAMSGDTASFLAGGEFPVPVQQQAGVSGLPVVTIEFKQFGVQLSFTPTILKDGLINVVVNPEVSDIDTDPNDSFLLGTIRVPGLKVRRAHTTVELRDGESFTIAGMLRDDYTNQIRQYPFVGDLPIIGALFRSTGFQRDETELVVVVTPHLVTPHRGPTALPTDHFVPPSDFELFLFGALQNKGAGLKPEDRALLSSDPSKGGVDGPHGHVLF